MGGHLKGDVDLPAGDTVYRLRFSIDALCTLEDISGKSFPEIAAELQDPAKARIGRVRQLLYAALRQHHPAIDLREAGEIILTAGGMVAVMEKVGEAFAAAFPQAEKGSGRAAENPPTSAPPAKAGTGKRS
ncbi:MAG: hypothetical protein ACOY6K_05440 [Pseudomonadota bacterium]